MTALSNLKKLRPCGRLETHSTARHHLGFYKNVGFTAEYLASESPESSLEDRIYIALRNVIAQHSVLTAITLDEDQSYPNVYFAQLPEIDLRTCVEIHERQTPFPNDGEADEELDQHLAEQHSRDFKNDLGSKPFWRLLVLTSPQDASRFTATWVWHHALLDGSSALLFHESFLAGLNTSELKANADPVVKSSSMALAPPFEEMHPMTITWPYHIKAILSYLIPSVFENRPWKLWTGNPVQPDATPIPYPHYRTLVLSKATTNKLVQVSRSEKTSVTATLQCLLAASLFTHIPAEDCERLDIGGPISMKRFLGVEEKQMTEAVGYYNHLHERVVSQNLADSAKPSVLQYFSWDTARAVKSTISAEVAKSGVDNPVALLKYVSSMPQYFLDKLGKPRDSSAEISSVGVWKQSHIAGNWTVGRMVFSQSFNVVANPLKASVVTGGDGNATLNFCWAENAVDNQLVRDVIEGFKSGVEELVSGDHV